MPARTLLVLLIPTICASGQAFGYLSADCADYAAVPLPPEAASVVQPQRFPGCASYRDYAGIDRKKDVSRARSCALQERAAQKANLAQNPREPLSWVVGGSLILANLYVNGAGVRRQVPLALRFACEVEENLVRVAVQEFEKFQAPKAVDFCDYAASTFTLNFCLGYASEIQEDKRRRYFDSLVTLMTASQRAAFAHLREAEAAYVEAHADEVGQGGSIRAVRTLGTQNILRDLFRTQMVWFERGQWPKLRPTAVDGAESSLASAFANTLMTLKKRDSTELYEGAVSSEGVERAQRAWTKYRDAWVAFAKVRYPNAVDLIRAYVTLDRVRLLKTIE